MRVEINIKSIRQLIQRLKGQPAEGRKVPQLQGWGFRAARAAAF